LTGPGSIPYTPVQDCFEAGDANVWLTRSLLNTFIVARRAGLKVDMPREYTEWQSHPMLLLPSPLTATERNLTHVHTAFWDEVREYVRMGGTVYISLCAYAAIPEMSQLFGVSLADHASVGDVSLTFVKQFGDITPGAVFRYSADPANPRHWPATLDVTDGQVIATDQDGRPALVARVCGHGEPST
jgi:beta-galactosidase